MKQLKETNSITCKVYDLLAEKYHALFKDELSQKEYDRKLIDNYAQYFSPCSIIYDVGCGPSGHIGKYLFDKGLNVTGIDISEKCIDIAKNYNRDMTFKRMDMMNLQVDDQSIDGIIAFYSIIHTPKENIDKIFQEFKRVLKSGGKVMLAVKEGKGEGLEGHILDSDMSIYFSYFTKKEVETYFISNGFKIIFLECRTPYSDEIAISRIYAIAESV
jgi:ubiquinone/menaquinone biosynthesis C-methylase UbiE